MNKVYTFPEFDKSLIKLSKKYQSLKTEYLEFIDQIEKEGIQGVSLGNGVYKTRLAVKSKGKGKSGGLRVISYQDVILTQHDNSIYLVAIYDKSNLSSMGTKQINQILRNNGL